jgi:hypothetical protein
MGSLTRATLSEGTSSHCRVRSSGRAIDHGFTIVLPDPLRAGVSAHVTASLEAWNHAFGEAATLASISTESPNS